MIRQTLLTLAFAVAAVAGHAQGTAVAFGGLQHDSSQPVEITAETLGVDQAAGTAEFKGDVVAGQGTLKLSAERVLVEYLTGEGQTGEINTIRAFGGVTMTNGAEAAEASEAVYTVAEGLVRMTGDVLLTQGQNAIAGEALNIDLNTGTALFEGRVRTVFRPASETDAQ